MLHSRHTPVRHHSTKKLFSKPGTLQDTVCDTEDVGGHQAIQPCEELLNVICQLSLMGILLLKISLKQGAYACKIYSAV